MVKIRLSRGGRKKQPVYTIVAADSRNARDGRFLEKLGHYNPNASGEMLSGVRPEAIGKWLSQGAQMSETVRGLLKKQKIEIQLG